MFLHCPHALPREVHVLEIMAVAEFERVVRLQTRPLVLSQLASLVEELLARVDGAENRAPDFHEYREQDEDDQFLSTTRHG